jgi:hypothetical protein
MKIKENKIKGVQISKKSQKSQILLKYWLEFLLGFIFLVLLVFNFIFLKDIALIDLGEIDIVIVLLPLVLTILSITLSLPRERIYGVDKTEFRKIRGPKTYNFLEMLIITIVIFSLYTLSKILDYSFIIWFLDFVAIVYSIIFIVQEIPMLMHDDKKIQNIISRNIKNDTKEIKAYNALQYLLLTKGIKEAFFALNAKDNDDKKKYLDILLDLQNNFLFEYIDNYTLVIQSLSNEYKHIEILQAINIAIENIRDILNLDSELNILEIYGDEEHFYQITRSLFSLHIIMGKLEFNRKFQKEFSSLISSIFMKIRYGNVDKSATRFLYKILNAMIISSISSNDIWFLELLRNSSFNDTFAIDGSDEYMVFISIYLYYISKLENRVPNDFKNKINTFVSDPSNNIDNNSQSWSIVLKHRLEYMDYKEIINLLPRILHIYECNNRMYNWYEPHQNGVWTSSGSIFTKKLLINWWVGYVLSNDNFIANLLNSRISFTMPELIDNDTVVFAVELNKNWFDDSDVLIAKKNLPIFDFFGINSKIDKYLNSMDLVNTLRKYKNDRIKAGIFKEVEDHIKTPEIFKSFKEELVIGLGKAINDFPVLDKSIDLKNEEMKYFGILFDTRWSESLVKSTSDNLPKNLKGVLHTDFIENLEIKNRKRTYTVYTEELLQEILTFAPEEKSAYIYDSKPSKKKRDLIEKINQIASIERLWLPQDLFIRNKPIRVNFESVPENSFVRPLTSDETNTIVDRDYKLVNGLYKFVEGADGERSVLLTREEIVSLVGSKFFYARIVFKYKVVYKVNDILFFDKYNKV